MTVLEELYDRIENEYYGLREEWSEYEFEELMCDVGKIAKMKSIYNYIRQHEPFSEKQAEHFLKMQNPFQVICNRYDPSEGEIHEEYKTVIDDIYAQKITDMQSQPYFADLKWQMYHEKEKYEDRLAPHIDKNAFRNVSYNLFIENHQFDEYQSRVLMQFKEPLIVLVKEIGSTEESFDKQVERVMETLGSVDLLTYQHELNKDFILPETRQRHEEIIELIDAITADEDELEEADVDLTDMLLTTEQEELEDVIESDFAIDVAIAMEEFTDEELLAFYERLDHEHVAQVLEQMDEDMQQRFIDLLDYEAILGIFKYMSNDDIADIIGEMPVNRRKTILRRLKSSDEVQSLLLYADDTAGGIMTTEYIALSANMTIEKALAKIKEIADMLNIKHY